MTTYDLPDELEVTSDGPVRVVRLNRPDHLNAANHELPQGLAARVPADRRRRRGPGGRPDRKWTGRSLKAETFTYLDELAHDAGPAGRGVVGG